MPLTYKSECRCCQRMVRTGEKHHCKDCWNKFHNGIRDGDYMTEIKEKRLKPLLEQKKLGDGDYENRINGH